MPKCVICQFPEISVNEAAAFTICVKCPRCGTYFINEGSYEMLGMRSENLPHTASSWIKEQNRLYNTPPMLYDDDLEMLRTIPDKTIESKLELFMNELNQKGVLVASKTLNTNKDGDPSWLSVTWSKDYDELQAIIQEAINTELIAGDITTFLSGDWSAHLTSLTFKGRSFIESLGHIHDLSNKVFLAFHFTNEMKETFEKTVRKAITDISDGKLEAVRVSTSGTSTETKIDDALISMIKSSRVVIADFTGQRTAVYYEAGFAMGLGIPVIWTCREDEVDKLSFDTRQYPHILWKDEKDLYKQLSERISAQIL